MHQSLIKEVGVKASYMWIGGFLMLLFVLYANPVAAQPKVGHVNTQKILEGFKEAQDARKQFDEINKGWEEEFNNMRREYAQKRDELESQALLLSEEKKREKLLELQNLELRIQQYAQEKWGQNGEGEKKQAEIMQPLSDKIVNAVKKISEQDKFDYVFDNAANIILYVSPNQVDLTAKVLEELNKTVATTKPAGATK